MQITSFTASRRVGFVLPEDVRAAVQAMTDACHYAIRHPGLAEALEEVEGVRYVATDDMSETSGPVFVDISSGAAVDTEDRVLEALRNYACASISMAALAPELLDPPEEDVWRGACEILYVHDDFVVSSADHGSTMTVHHFRNGLPCRATVDEDGLLDIIRGEHAKEAVDRAVVEWACAKVPLLARRTTGQDADALMAGHSLERLVPVGRFGTAGNSVAYIDRDLVAVTDRHRRVVVHFRREGRYSLKILQDDLADELLDLTSILGLDTEDDENPVRTFVRSVADFDIDPAIPDHEAADESQFAP